MNNTLRKIRKAREFSREIDGWNLKLRRPTDAEATLFKGEEISHIEIGKKFVIGWEDVTEEKLVPGGSSDPVEFDPDLWAEVLVDQPQIWDKLTSAILESFLLYRKAKEDRAKK